VAKLPRNQARKQQQRPRPDAATEDTTDASLSVGSGKVTGSAETPLAMPPGPHHRPSANSSSESRSPSWSSQTSKPAPSPPAPAASGRVESDGSAWAAQHKAMVAQFPQRHRQMCLLGVVLVAAFYVLDVMYPWPDTVKLTARQFFGVRALWVAGYLLLMATSYYREQSERLQLVREFLLLMVTSACVGVLCAHTGRLSSPYYAGLSILSLARFVMMPGGFSRAAPASLFMVVVWLLCTTLWPSPFPRPGFDGWRGVTTLCFLLGAMVPGLWGTVLTDRLALGLETAKMMGRYRLSRRLGAGGMGEVHLAYHASLRRPCAVKILKEELCDPLATARFEREAEAASRLRHPNTIAVFDFGRTDNGRPYYVMEYLEGCDLGQLVRREGALPPERVCYLLEQVAGSLGEAHALSMIHRDVKPGNLFVTSMGGHGDFVKVLDFGLVKGVDLGPELTRQDAFMGTPRYMAPEALSGQKVDCRVDVYALGSVGYFLLCGEPPFASGDAYLDIYRQINDPPPPIATRRGADLPAPSEALVAVLMRCLEKDRERRYASATEVMMALQKTPEHGLWHPQAVRSSGLELEAQAQGLLKPSRNSARLSESPLGLPPGSARSGRLQGPVSQPPDAQPKTPNKSSKPPQS